MKKKRKDPNIYPPGLNAKKVASIIAHYDSKQGDDLFKDKSHRVVRQRRFGVAPTIWLEIPTGLLPEVEKLLTTYLKSA